MLYECADKSCTAVSVQPYEVGGKFVRATRNGTWTESSKEFLITITKCRIEKRVINGTIRRETALVLGLAEDGIG